MNRSTKLYREPGSVILGWKTPFLDIGGVIWVWNNWVGYSVHHGGFAINPEG